MKSKAAIGVAILMFAGPLTGQYKQAASGYGYEFPRDYFNHDEFQTEWWYYTGNLTASDGHRFGFELTFFRQGVDRTAAKAETWDVRDVYLAHLALSDLDGGAFYHAERTNRAGPGIAGVKESEKQIWNGNWKVSWNGQQQKLEAVEDRFSFSLLLNPEKAPVIHGENGISRKGAGTGQASHYVSLTRLRTQGKIQLGDKNYPVSGLAWMDHEFFTEQLAPELAGWDWFSVQLDNGAELMLYRLRRKDGSVDLYSSGTFVDAQGHTNHLRSDDFSLTPGGVVWQSAETGADYPIEWNVAVPKLNLQLVAKTHLKSQELASKSRVVPSYWEGAMEFRGTQGKVEVDGVGYLEMTGYDRAIR